MGARIESDIDREITSWGVTCFKNDVSRAVAMLGDALSNPTLDSAEFEMCKQEQMAENNNMNKDGYTTSMEAVHYNAYRDHMMGQPIRGDPDNLQNIGVDALHAFREANYCGDNMVVVGTGNVDHEAFVQAVTAGFSGISQQAGPGRANDDQCVYTPALLFMRDDECYNANCNVFYDAPSVNHEDYYSFQLLKYMIGDYEIQKNSEHVNDVANQYNATHMILGELPDVTRQKCQYFAYSDCGLWGNWLFGNEVFARQMNWAGLAAVTTYGGYINEVEVVRARNNMWNDLMAQHSNEAQNAEIGRQMIQTGRRVTRSEVAKRVSHIDSYFMKELCYEYFYDSEPSFTSHGAVESLSCMGSYKYYKLNTLTTITNMHQSLKT